MINNKKTTADRLYSGDLSQAKVFWRPAYSQGIEMLRLLGCFFVLLGFIGILLPLIPTTPFLLLAAGCFAKSSPTLHAKLMNSPMFGPILRDWEEKKCISPQIKLVAITSVVVFAGFSVLFVIPNMIGKAVGVAVIAISIAVISRIPTCPADKT